MDLDVRAVDMTANIAFHAGSFRRSVRRMVRFYTDADAGALSECILPGMQIHKDAIWLDLIRLQWDAHNMFFFIAEAGSV